MVYGEPDVGRWREDPMRDGVDMVSRERKIGPRTVPYRRPSVSHTPSIVGSSLGTGFPLFSGTFL